MYDSAKCDHCGCLFERTEHTGIAYCRECCTLLDAEDEELRREGQLPPHFEAELQDYERNK